MTEEVTVSGASPVVDTKRTTTGATFDVDTLEKIPTARDPWMIIYMAPGVQLSGTNVGGSGSGGQPTISSRGTSANVQWNLEGGSHHRPAEQHLGLVLQLRFARADSGHQRRRRRLGAVERRLHQPGHQERQQRVQGLGSSGRS